MIDPNTYIQDWKEDQITQNLLDRDNVCLEEDPDEFYEKERERNYV